MNARTRFKLGRWTVSPALNLLESDERSIRIEPRTMDVLVCLVEHAGDVVSTDEIIAAVWRGRVVGDSAVYERIKKLRRAFDDDPRAARVIETVPKRGYRLVAPVDVLADAGGEPRRASEPLEHVSRTRVRFHVYAAALGLVAIATAVSLYLSSRPDTAAGSDDRRSIAVLPFVTESADEDAVFFTNGIHDELLTQLAKIDDLTVISRDSVAPYRGRPQNLRETGRELGVETILQAVVRQAGETVRINAWLSDVETADRLWAESYERRLTTENIFAIQRQMAMSIAETLEFRLSAEGDARFDKIPTENSQAYEYYLSGNSYYWRTDVDAVPLAIRMYERAIEEDPEFALAFARLSTAHAFLYWTTDRTPSRLRLAGAAARRALELAPDLPEAHLAMASYYYRGFRDYENALKELSVAKIGNPGNPHIYFIESFIQRRLGRWERAITTMERAIELDPLNMAQLNQHALTFRFLRKYAAAQEVLQRQLDIAPDYVTAYEQQLLIPLYRDGDVSLLKLALRERPMPGMNIGRLSWIAAFYERDYESALSYLGQLNPEREYREFERALSFARIYSLRGEHEAAREYFEGARGLAERMLAADTESPDAHIGLAAALAGLGEAPQALRRTDEAIELARSLRDVIGLSNTRLAAVKVLARAGYVDRAIEELDAYLAGPGFWSIEGLLADPELDPLREHTRFVHVARKYRRP